MTEFTSTPELQKKRIGELAKDSLRFSCEALGVADHLDDERAHGYHPQSGEDLVVVMEEGVNQGVGLTPFPFHA